MTSEAFAAMSLRRVGPNDKLSKPRQVRERREFFRELAAGTNRRMRCVLAHKADGRSGLLRYKRGATMNDRGDTFELEYRTDSGGHVVSIPLPGRLIQQDILLYDAVLKVEICAMLDGRLELGHYHVEAAVKAFVANGFCNTGRLHLRLRIFNLYRITVDGRHLTPRLPPLRLLGSAIVPGNGLLDVVPFREYTLAVHKGDVVFTDSKGKVLPGDYEDFCQMALDETKKDGGEGWVLYVPEDEFEGPPTRPDGYETERIRAALKVKREFTARYAVVKINCCNDKEDVTETRLYSRKGTKLVYAGNVTGHPIIERDMSKKAAIHTYSTDAERKALYELDFGDVQRSRGALQFEVTSAGLTVKHYLPTGIKIYGTRKVDRDLLLEHITDTRAMGMDNPHFVSMKRAREELKDIQDDEEEQCRPSKKPRPSMDPPQVVEPVEITEHPVQAEVVEPKKATPYVSPKVWEMLKRIDRADMRLNYHKQAMIDHRLECATWAKSDPVKKQVYIHEDAVFTDQQLTEIKGIVTGDGHTMVQEPADSETLIAVFSEAQMSRARWAGAHSFFVDKFPKATTTTPGHLSDKLRL